MVQIDLNCDLGESFGNFKIGVDEEILPFVTSANIACGFHAGDPTTMRKTVLLALKNNVSIGAHPGLPDLQGFGRRSMEISEQEAYDMVLYQIGALKGITESEGGKLRHVKPHGALYNMAAKDRGLAEAIAKAVLKIDSQIILFGLAGSELVKAGKKVGIRVAEEVFADRTYQSDGTLTLRRQPNAFITENMDAFKQVLRMIKEGRVRSVQGNDIMIQADTVCIHGDGIHALHFASYIRDELEKAKVVVKSIDGENDV